MSESEETKKEESNLVPGSFDAKKWVREIINTIPPTIVICGGSLVYLTLMLMLACLITGICLLYIFPLASGNGVFGLGVFLTIFGLIGLISVSLLCIVIFISAIIGTCIQSSLKS
jgi:hypothetical protein